MIGRFRKHRSDHTRPAQEDDALRTPSPKGRQTFVSPPIVAIVGWIEGAFAKDAEAYARGFIERRFDAQDASFFATAAFLDGYFYEVHEGGSGVSHLPAIVERLSHNPDAPVWFPSGRRVFQVEVRDGNPVGMLLSEEESKLVRESGVEPVEASGRMRPAVRSGVRTLATGCGIFSVGLFLLIASMIFHLSSEQVITVQRPVNIQQLPHRQWHLIAVPGATRTVEALELDQGEWVVRWRDNEGDQEGWSGDSEPGSGAADSDPQERAKP